MNPSVSIFTSVHPPDDPRIKEKGVRTLVQHGWRVTYICRSPGPTAVDGFRVKTLSGGRIRRTIKAMRLMVTSRSDVIVVHDPELLVAAIPIGWVRGKNRVVFDLHENLPGQLRTRQQTPSWLRGMSAWMARALLRMGESAVTITLAEPGYQSLFSQQHQVFENLPVTGSLPTRQPNAHGIVYVGDITLARGAMLLVDAVGMLEARTRLTLIGRCAEELEKALRAAATEYDIELVMPGYLNYSKAWSLAAGSLVGVSPLTDLPNYRYSLPTKIVEYRSVGLIAVVSDLPASLDAIAGSTAARSFAAEDEADLARVLSDVLADVQAAQAAHDESSVVRESSTWPADRFDAFHRSLIS